MAVRRKCSRCDARPPLLTKASVDVWLCGICLGSEMREVAPPPTRVRVRKQRRNHGASHRARNRRIRQAPCFYCGRGETSATVDHVWPLSMGGPNAATNVVACCLPCNEAKDNMHPEEWALIQEALGRDVRELRRKIAAWPPTSLARAS